jgi:acetyl esterase/lipase
MAALWPDEYEDLREEARQMSDLVREAIGGPGGPAPATAEDRIAQLRAAMKALESSSADGHDERVAGVPCRVFHPATRSRGTYLHFHGGAMMLGSPLMNDIQNADICRRFSVDVVSVDYRLAPEHRFPAGADDCLAVADAVLGGGAGVTGGKVVVGGESAGGYFAALTALRIRDELGAIDRVAGANLVFGVYDLSGTPSNRGSRPSEVIDVLDDDTSGFVEDYYLPVGADPRDPAVSPLYARLDRLPPALFTVGSADHLLDDSLFMHARWLSFGSSAELAVYPDCVHGFTMTPTALAKHAMARIDDFVEATFSS